VELEQGWRVGMSEAEREVQALREELAELELARAAEDTQLREWAEQMVIAGVHVRVEQVQQQWTEKVDAVRQDLERAKRARTEWQVEASSRATQAQLAHQANEKLHRRLATLARRDVTDALLGATGVSGGATGVPTKVVVNNLSRAAHIAEALRARSMVSPGINVSLLAKLEHDEWEGLQKGADDAFIEAVEAYIEVCSSEQADRKQLQAWQKHAAAPFSEALMELVAMYRTAKPEPKPEFEELTTADAVSPSGGALTPGKGTVPQVSSANSKPGGKKRPAGGAKKPRAAGSATAAQKRDSIRASAVYM
jgi:DNA repair exonuclease SbcCD ATPase subunit